MLFITDDDDDDGSRRGGGVQQQLSTFSLGIFLSFSFVQLTMLSSSYSLFIVRNALADPAADNNSDDGLLCFI